MINILSRPQEKLVMAFPERKLVWVQVMSVTDNIVKLGFEAPQEISVWREEVWERIQRERGYV